MLLRTHVMFAIFMILVFINYVSNKWVFVAMVLVATIVPDLDSGFSSYGRHLIFRPLQFFTKHRGILHSITTAAILSFLIAVWFPVASFGFFIGYSIHVISDSFTKDGVQPFWPLKWKSNGPISSGGRIEESLFIFMVIINILMFLGFLVVG